MSGEIRAFLERRSYPVDVVTSLASATTELRRAPPDIAIIDGELPHDGDDLIGTLRRADERVPIMMLVDATAKDQHLRALHEGTDCYVVKPVAPESLLIMMQRVFEAQQTRRRSMALNVQEQRRNLDPFVGTSAAIQTFARHAHQVLNSDAPVLIQGETGTGKGVLAGWLHHHGPRAEEALVDINCAGLSREFVESELFGHERGAFTGAAGPKLGLLDVAHRGTAFLDEIGEIDLQLQPRLLKVLEEKRFRRLGDVRDRVVDIRLIAATNRDLAKRSREGTFRADLYYRINTISLTVPALRQRREDIPLLARRIANSLGHDIDFSHDAIHAMQAYDWPGNVRELRNVIERAIVISNRSARITPNHLRFEVQVPDAADPDLMCTLVEAERRHIERVLRFENGSVERAALRLGVSRSTLYQKLRRFRIEDEREESDPGLSGLVPRLASGTDDDA
ncbi:MAG: sigma-54-dependent transcriptional regulator [Kofleriaceae bacterium]